MQPSYMHKQNADGKLRILLTIDPSEVVDTDADRTVEVDEMIWDGFHLITLPEYHGSMKGTHLVDEAIGLSLHGDEF